MLQPPNPKAPALHPEIFEKLPFELNDMGTAPAVLIPTNAAAAREAVINLAIIDYRPFAYLLSLMPSVLNHSKMRAK
jgi:hypothetical protein